MTRVMNKQKKIDAYNFPYTFNPYTGCPYCCHYCYTIKSALWSARLKNWGIKPNIAKPKLGVVQKLQRDLQDLKNIQTRYKEVQIGNFFDPYPPIEPKLKITRQCLDVFRQYPDWKVHLETKSPLILNDMDIIKQMPRFEAEITITTLTHDKQFEPNAPSTKERFNLIKELNNNGIFTRVMIMPILEGYTDVRAIIQKATRYGAKSWKSKELHYFTIKDLKTRYNIK